MVRLAVDEFGQKKSRSILGGRAAVVCYENEPLLWQYRQKATTGTRRYIWRKLNEPDLAVAVRKAEDLYLELRDEDKPSNEPISKLIDEWIHIKEQRQAGGAITAATVRGVKTALGTVIRTYLIKYKKLHKISEIKQDTFLDFSEWRNTKAWQLIDCDGGNKPPKASTIKRDLVHLKDWYKNFLIPRSYAIHRYH